MSKISLSQLLKAKVYFGHETSNWNPEMFPYLYGKINNNHILNLEKSLILLEEANTFVEKAAQQGKKFLFIGTKREAASVIAEEAIRCNSYFVNSRWLGGTLTNWEILKQRINRLNSLEKAELEGSFNLLIKKEATARKKELDRLRKNLTGVRKMVTLPDIAIIIDQKYEITAINECKKLGIPIISLLDSDCDPKLVDIPIPGNDDATESIKLILNSLTNSILKGQLKH